MVGGSPVQALHVKIARFLHRHFGSFEASRRWPIQAGQWFSLVKIETLYFAKCKFSEIEGRAECFFSLIKGYLCRD
jgi:hypothetical protein